MTPKKFPDVENNVLVYHDYRDAAQQYSEAHEDVLLCGSMLVFVVACFVFLWAFYSLLNWTHRFR